VPREDNTNFAAIEAETVHFRASLLSILFFRETDEPKTTATTTGAVKRGVYVTNVPELGKNGTKFVGASFVTEVVHFHGE